jgi:uncharacterized membrane protein YoaK (UPF0700 family)
MSAGAALMRRRHVLVVLLAVNSGATDALGFLALGGAFTSVMTGNMVLSGTGLATGDWKLVLLAASAILCFCVGCAAGARVAGTPQEGDGAWPRPICWALTVQLVITAAFAAGWWFVDAEPSDLTALCFLVMNAVGLGIQSSAVQRFGQSGLSTTYLTGTLTTLVVRLTTGRAHPGLRRSADILAGLIGGAALAAALMSWAPMTAPTVQLVCLAAVLTGGLLTGTPTGARRDAAAVGG